MTNLGTMTKGLLGATALSFFMSGNAFAAPLDLTPAGTNVQNTFTLDYQVSGVDQPTIDTGPSGSDTPTEFTVDRLIDLTVDSTADANVAPDAQDQTLEYSITNTGNDTQAYDLSLADPADDFDATGLTVLYYVDDGDGVFDPDTGSGGADGVGVPYVPGTTGATADIAADGVLWVVVTGDIPDTVADGDTDGITLVADTLEPSTAGATAGDPVVADTGGNTLTGVAENVLGDDAGVTDAANAGDHSATGTFIVAAADVTASKVVSVFLQDGVDAATCGTFPGSADADPLSIPGSCVEYVISATNDAGASSTATAIDISDFLPQQLTFAGAITSGFGGTPAPSLTAPTVGTDCSPTATTCEVSLTGAELAPGATGTITIRALVQ